jgi:hypothetical protein
MHIPQQRRKKSAEFALSLSAHCPSPCARRLASVSRHACMMGRTGCPILTSLVSQNSSGMTPTYTSKVTAKIPACLQ